MIIRIAKWFFNQSRSAKRIVSLLTDGIIISAVYWAAFILHEDRLDILTSGNHWRVLLVLTLSSVGLFTALGLYRSIIRYLDYRSFISIAIGVSIPVFLMAVCANFFKISLPIDVAILFTSCSILFCGGARLGARSLYRQLYKLYKQPVIVYGAGEAGRQLANSLQPGAEYKVVAFIDDDKSLHRSFIHGIKVYPQTSLTFLINKYGVKKLLLAIPSLSKSRRRSLIESLSSISIELLTIPALSAIVNGGAKLNDLQKVNPEDLLGRDLVAPFPDLMSANIYHKVVLVTGAGGSIGSALCTEILSQEPTCLVLFELTEFALYQVEQTLKRQKNKHNLTSKIIPILGSVADEVLLQRVVKAFKVQTIYHAAAYKHVPLVEYNMIEGVKNNVFGTHTAAKVAVACKVETFVLISTDKAVRPPNVMGASKRLAELICQSFNDNQPHTTFCMVRFGNVLGSSGSVVPMLRRQILEGGPVTITHPDITRYFMSINEAAQLVIQAGALSTGGDVFVLHMGEPIKILELAKKMIRLMGYQMKEHPSSNGNIEIKITQLRPGEKLYEELLISDSDKPTKHPRINTAKEHFLPFDELNALLDNVKLACLANDLEMLRAILIEAPLEYSPTVGINDLVDSELRRQVQPITREMA